MATKKTRKKISSVLIVYGASTALFLNHIISKTQEILKRNRIQFIVRERDQVNEKDFSGKDLIVIVGGDGTFLRASHFIVDETPVVGINSNPHTKEGFFNQLDHITLEKRLLQIIRGKYKIVKLPRLCAKMGKRHLRLALNEYYIGFHKSYHTARYELIIGEDREVQKSSGVIVAASSGSYGWAKSCGAKPLPLESRDFVLVIREPYFGRLSSPKMLKKVFNSHEHVEIISHMKDGAVVVDSLSKEYKFNPGQKVKISMSNRPLHFIMFEDMTKDFFKVR